MSRTVSPSRVASGTVSPGRLGGVDLLLLSVAAMWGANFSVVKVGLADVPPLFFASARFVVALAVMIPLAWLMGHSLTVEPGQRLVVAGVGLLGNSAYMILFVHGVARTTANNAAMILASVPVWVAVIGSIAGLERIARAGWIGVSLSLAGIYLVVKGSATGETLEFGGASVQGDALVLLATLAWSGYSLLVRPLVRRSSPVSVTVLSTAAGTLPLVLLTVPRLRLAEVEAISARGWGALGLSALIGIALPYLIWNYAILKLGSARTSLYSYLVPLIGLVVARFWLGERLAPVQLVGGALVLVGVILARRFVTPAD